MPRLVVHATIHVTPKHVDETKEVLKVAMRESLAEPGCEYYVATQDQEDPTKFRVFEIYKSLEAAQEHHRTTFQKIGTFIGQEGVLAEPLGVERHELVEDVERGIVA